jgi:NADH-quinone oxidoreductase subunit M
MNAAELPILSIMLAVPMIGALACLFARAEMARIVALTATLFNLLLGVWL